MKVDLLLTTQNPYSYESFVASKMKEAFEKREIEAPIISMQDPSFFEYLATLAETSASFLFSFSPQVPHLGKVAHISHFIWGQGSLAPCFHHLQEPLGWVGSHDREYSQSLSPSVKGNLFFLPPAYDPAIQLNPATERPFDCVLFEALVDLSSLERRLQEFFSLEALDLLRHLSQLEKPSPLATLFSNVPLLDQFKSRFTFSDLLFGLEEYLKAKRIVSLVEKVEGFRLDLFGTHMGNNWLQRLKNRDNIYLHSSLPFTEHLELLRKTKILLIDHLLTPDGVHEWFFQALSLGVLVIAARTPFLEELLGKECPILYTPGIFEEAHDKIRAFLAHPQERMQLVGELREKISSHTYEKRAEEIINAKRL